MSRKIINDNKRSRRLQISNYRPATDRGGGGELFCPIRLIPDGIFLNLDSLKSTSRFLGDFLSFFLPAPVESTNFKVH